MAILDLSFRLNFKPTQNLLWTVSQRFIIIANINIKVSNLAMTNNKTTMTNEKQEILNEKQECDVQKMKSASLIYMPELCNKKYCQHVQ